MDDKRSIRPDLAEIRTHLANERTFLAWLRTALVLLGVGLGPIALAEKGAVARTPAIALGSAVTLASVTIVLWTSYDYLQKVRAIARKDYVPTTWPVIVSAVGAVVIAGLVLAFIVVELI